MLDDYSIIITAARALNILLRVILKVPAELVVGGGGLKDQLALLDVTAACLELLLQVVAHLRFAAVHGATHILEVLDHEVLRPWSLNL